MMPEHGPASDLHVGPDHGEVAHLGVAGDLGGGVDLGGRGDGHGGSLAEVGRSFSLSYPPAPMPLLLALLAPTPEGYGVGLEWMVIVSFIAPVLLLAVIWWLGNRRIV